MEEVFVAVGSNVERERNVREGLRHLRERFGALRISPVYETEPVGFSGDNFLNLVLSFNTDKWPQDIADELREIEHLCGRAPDARKFEPRSLDLDLLLYGDKVIKETKLRLPRAEILRYGFILKPLADLIPERRHPGTGRYYVDLWSAFRGEGETLKPVSISLE